jgi:hypothetical protein
LLRPDDNVDTNAGITATGAALFMQRSSGAFRRQGTFTDILNDETHGSRPQ